MDKRESLAFLQSCIDRINVATDEEIAMFRKSYALNCSEFLESSDFQFIPPTDSGSYLYKKNEVIEINISETECAIEKSKVQWNYNIEGSVAVNEQSGESLPCAA